MIPPSSTINLGLLVLAMSFLSQALSAQTTYNVKTYGAQGNGFADDTRALQAAIDSAHSAGSGIVYFPASSGCYMASGLTFYSNLNYIGENPSVCIKSISSSAPLVDTPATSAFSNVTIARLTFNGNAKSLTGYDCLELRGPTNVVLDKVTTTQCGEDGVYVTGWGTGTNPSNPGQGLLITNLTSTYNGRNGMSIIAGSHITVRDSVFEHHNISAPFAGVDIETNTAAQSVANVTFENCTFLDNAYNGFTVWESHANRPNLNLRLINSTFQSNGRDGAYIAASGYVLGEIYVSGKMSANRAQSGYRGGLDIWNATSVVVTNFSVVNASQALFLWGVNGATVANSSLSGSSLDLNTNSSSNVQVYNSTQLAHQTHSGLYSTRTGTAPAITTQSPLPAATANTVYSDPLLATGDANISWALLAGTLPPGLTLSSTGTVTGTPTTGGTYLFTVQPINAVTYDEKTYTLVVSDAVAAAPLAISTSSLPNGTVNSSYSATLTATGGTTPYTWSASGLPAGLSLNSSSGQITGTPTIAGSANITALVKDATSTTANRTFTVSIAPSALAISTSSLPNGTVSSAYSAILTATGGTTPYTWSASGLPPGLSLNASTGQITGTPTAAGSTSVTAQVKDATSTGAAKTFTLSIAAPPTSQQTFNVQSYGALGNGSTNDTSAIQNAINAAHTAGNGVVYFPSSTGCYRVTSLNFYSGLTYTGQTSSVCIKSLNPGMGANLINTSPSGGAFSNATISNLVLDGNTSAPASRYDCLELIAPTNVYISNVTAQYCDEDGFYVTGYGSNSATPGNGLLMTNVTANHSGRNGMSIITGINITVRNSVFENSNSNAPFDGVDIEPNNASQTVQNITFENSSFLNNGNSSSSEAGHQGFNVWQTYGNLPNLNLRLINCTFSGNLRDGLYAAASGYTLGSISVIGGTMSNNRALNGYRGGVDIWNTSNVVISNLSVTSPSQAVFLYGVSGATVANSTLSGVSADLNTNNSTGVAVYTSTKLVNGTHSGSYTTPSGVAPTITVASLTAGTTGAAYSQALSATGTSTMTWAAVSATGNNLPPGISLSPSGLLSGTPTAFGTYTFTVQATNGVAFDEKTFTLTIN